MSSHDHFQVVDVLKLILRGELCASILDGDCFMGGLTFG